MFPCQNLVGYDVLKWSASKPNFKLRLKKFQSTILTNPNLKIEKLENENFQCAENG
jgi:hypothetical protein